VNTTPYQGVNVSSTSVDTHHDWALENEDSSAMDSATNKGNSAGKVPLEEMGPHTRGDLLDTPNHRVYSPSKQVPVTFVVPPWLGHG